MYSHGRWVSAAVLLLFVLYNMFSLIRLDTMFIIDPVGTVTFLGG